MPREVAFAKVRALLADADFSRGDALLTPEQLTAYNWLEMLYYDGEITYRQLWKLSTGRY